MIMKETVVFNGVKYHRNLESKYYTNRCYFIGSRQSKTVRLHDELYKAFKGDIPNGHHIHHKDGNPSNNAIENLEPVAEGAHHSIHSRASSEERSKKLFAFWEKRESHAVVCVSCGETFQTTCTKETSFCSNKCRKRNRRIKKLEKETRLCVICGNKFETYKYSKAQTCSHKCSGALRKMRGKR
jgi:predicted nucleic acid-binding Zn ribbon protein